jgi:hypothetical protein
MPKIPAFSAPRFVLARMHLVAVFLAIEAVASGSNLKYRRERRLMANFNHALP